jgi:radical SAM superfamily enzyme YgiQ (UPF0313 family)
MPDIVLATLNAKYAHASLGLRCLASHLGQLQDRACIREYTLKSSALEVAESLLALNPRIIGLGVYIWNVAPTTELVFLLKRLRPSIRIVLGGPEVSHELDQQPWLKAADVVITGEGEVSFARVCEVLLAGHPVEPVVRGEAPDLTTAPLPYALYTDEDIAHRIVYVEASRGCPFSCEFCLSALDEKVRHVPLDRFLGEMDLLFRRGVRHFKFIDRTFNLKLDISRAILEFFLARYEPGLFLHFEMIPDRLPEALREPLQRFPAGAVQLEIGIQTFNAEVSTRISRHQDVKRLEQNLQFLKEHSGVHLHADLIVGLPGETLESFGKGFDQLFALRPHEIQVGLLKRLKGTPIARHEAAYGLVYSPAPPFEILQTAHLDFSQMLRLRRFAKFWELCHNSGNFPRSLARVLAQSTSAFQAFLALSDRLYARFQRTHGISLESLAEALFDDLCATGLEKAAAAEVTAADYFANAQRRIPPFLSPFITHVPRAPVVSGATPVLPPRQGRHAQPRSA